MNSQLFFQLHQLAHKIMEDGELSYVKGDGATIFEILALLDQHYEGNDLTEDKSAWLLQWLLLLHRAYGWDHPRQSEVTEKNVLKTFVYMHLYVI